MDRLGADKHHHWRAGRGNYFCTLVHLPILQVEVDRCLHQWWSGGWVVVTHRHVIGRMKLLLSGSQSCVVCLIGVCGGVCAFSSVFLSVKAPDSASFVLTRPMMVEIATMPTVSLTHLSTGDCKLRAVFVSYRKWLRSQRK